MSCKRYSSAFKSMSPPSDNVYWMLPALLVLVLLTAIWPPAAGILVLLGAALAAWKG